LLLLLLLLLVVLVLVLVFCQQDGKTSMEPKSTITTTAMNVTLRVTRRRRRLDGNWNIYCGVLVPRTEYTTQV